MARRGVEADKEEKEEDSDNLFEEFDLETRLRADVSKLLEPTFRRGNENQAMLK